MWNWPRANELKALTNEELDSTFGQDANFKPSTNMNDAIKLAEFMNEEKSLRLRLEIGYNDEWFAVFQESGLHNGGVISDPSPSRAITIAAILAKEEST